MYYWRVALIVAGHRHICDGFEFYAEVALIRIMDFLERGFMDVAMVVRCDDGELLMFGLGD